MKNSIVLLSGLKPEVKKALQVIYGDLRDKPRFTFTEFRKTPGINLGYGNPDFRKLSRSWRYILDNTLVEINILKRYKASNYYVKRFNTLEEWAKTQARSLLSDVKKIEQEGLIKAIKKEEVKTEKTDKMLEIERRFNKSINLLLAELYVNEDLSSYQIAEKFGVSNATILEWSRRCRIRTSMTPPKASKPDKKELRDLYVNQHKSTLQIAEKFGVSVSTAYLWLKENGIKIRDRSAAQLQKGSKKPTKKELEGLYIGKDLSISEIAKKLNYPQPTLHRWLKEYGIT